MSRYSQWNAPSDSQQSAETLDELVAGVVQLLESRLSQQGIWVNCEVPTVPVPLPVRDLKRAIYQMVADACNQMVQGGDLSISAYVDGRQVEVEVADSATVPAASSLTGSNKLRQVAMQCGGQMRLVNCAQGGTARILQIGSNQRRAAA